MRQILPLCLACTASLSALAAQAQAPATSDAGPSRPAFSQLFPQPTGRNGYEDLVLAADVVRAHGPFQRALRGTPSLDQKRQLLADRNLTRALALVRQGLRKPIVSPRRELNFSTLLPEISPLRDLGRLLAMQEYVFLADGRTTDALATLRLGLGFARAIQFDTLIQGLVGVAITALVLAPITRRLDQFSAADCTRLYDLCVEWLNQPNPYLHILSGEWGSMRRSLQDVRDQAVREGPEKAAATLTTDPKDQQQFRGLIPQAPAAVNEVFDDLLRRIDQHFLRLQAELRKDPWERRPVPVDGSGNAGAFLGMLAPAYEKVDTTYTRDNARLRLLALHAAIRRYQWEFDRLPPSLAALNPGELARDPFTGEEVRYEVKGLRYSLTAAGPASDNADDPRAVGGRIPVRLTPDD